MKPIETWYNGHRFRSRLEARWAVAFDHLDIPYLYEHEGFVIGGRPYLPDFLLTQCETWVEVKGSESALDKNLMCAAPEYLPGGSPRLLILGPIPAAPEGGDWAWLGFDLEDIDGERVVMDGWWALDAREGLVAARETSCATGFDDGDGWLIPALNMIPNPDPRVVAAYRADRTARFEHGEKG